MTDLSALEIDKSRLHLVWNGVSPAPPADRAAIRRDWGCGPEHFVLGSVARLEPQKNPLLMLRLLAELPPQVRLVWIGDGSLMQATRNEAQLLGVADRVILPGWQHNARSFQAGFDAFVLPSRYEGFPLAILECDGGQSPLCRVRMSMGSARRSSTEKQGFVCPPNGVDVWNDRIRRYLENPDSCRKRSGAVAFALYSELFSLDAMARKTASVYLQAVASRCNSLC